MYLDTTEDSMYNIYQRSHYNNGVEDIYVNCLYLILEHAISEGKSR